MFYPPPCCRGSWLPIPPSRLDSAAAAKEAKEKAEAEAKEKATGGCHLCFSTSSKRGGSQPGSLGPAFCCLVVAGV